MTPLLKVKDLSVHYRTSGGVVRAIERVSFNLEEGRYLGIVGESGCGKTTVAKAILRLLPKMAKLQRVPSISGVEKYSPSPKGIFENSAGKRSR